MELGRPWSSQILVLAFGANLGYHNFEVVILVVSMVIFDMLQSSCKWDNALGDFANRVIYH